jgi:hypothetical protein
LERWKLEEKVKENCGIENIKGENEKLTEGSFDFFMTAHLLYSPSLLLAQTAIMII